VGEGREVSGILERGEDHGVLAEGARLRLEGA